MRVQTVCIVLVLSFICLSCTNPSDAKREEKPLTTEYDPQKAGAVIAESFDISNSVFFPQSGSDKFRITTGYDLAEYDEDMYIRIQDRLYIFDKQTMNKKKEIRLNFPFGHNYLCDEFQGLLVTGDFTLLQFRLNSSDSRGRLYYSRVLSIDEATGNVTILDIEKTFGAQLKYKGAPLMGYDKANDLLWFWSRDSETSNFYFFRYDKETKTFTDCGTKNGFSFVGYERMELVVGIYMYNFETWALHYSVGRNVHIKGIDKRKLDNPAEVLYRIDAEYLGVDKRFYYSYVGGEKGIIYDPPYIWIMVERDYQIQMLKLLPNG